MSEVKRIQVALISAGSDSPDHQRVIDLMDALNLSPEYFFRDRSKGPTWNFIEAWKIIRRNPGTIWLEGTGLWLGLACIAAATASKETSYLVSSGDAVGPYARNRWGFVVGVLMKHFERLLYRKSSGFLGWTPHLVGRAITLGAKRGATIEGFLSTSISINEQEKFSSEIAKRDLLGVNRDTIVVGVSGSLNWSERQEYCYGLELTKICKLLVGDHYRFLVIGDGSGLEHLKKLTRGDDRFVFTGRITRELLPRYLKAIDFAIIGQTSDELGLLRLTTKLPEYLALGVATIVPASPAMIDYLSAPGGAAAMFSPLSHPKSHAYAEAVANIITSTDRAELKRLKASAVKLASLKFSLEIASQKLENFLTSIEFPKETASEKIS